MLSMGHHLPVAITDGLHQRGIDAITCLEDGMDQWDDERILERDALLVA